MKFLISTLFLIAFQPTAFATAEDFRVEFDNGITGDFVWSAGSPKVGEASSMEGEVTFDGVPMNPANVEVVLWMPDHKHGTAPVTIKTSGSQIQVSDMHFVMGGKWEIRITLTDMVGNQTEGLYTIELDGGGHHN